MDVYGALEGFKGTPDESGVFSDLDGTISAIARTPEEAMVTDGVRAALRALATRFGVVGIVSGRDSDDAQRMVGIESLLYIGSHGLEWTENGAHHYAPEVAGHFGAAASLAYELNDYFKNTAVRVEKKRLGAALHYRLAEDKEAAFALIEPVVSKMLAKYPMRALSGRYVVELKPDVSIDKGRSVTAICLSRGLKHALYLGDDVTDIDAFRALRSLREDKGVDTVSVAVASAEAAPEVADAADYTIPDVDAAAALLAWLAD